uniref:2Fe-2S ferredoxin-type domain-containing protein n=1 Tax=Hemiselmis andersenii TaxID=464988 RepID=A0A7S0XY60_HEMAN|mmetsp:Transcript_29006/g.67858  ORF Transcript_29006/g.67858 Transcript_29006/m.67858 type:complete len:188 (+) Transcript_29006:41-604(+)
MAKLAASVALVGACLLDGASAFTAPAGHGVPALSFGRRAPAHSSTSIKMGFFDAIGKAVSESMGNDPNLGKQVNPGFRDGYDGPRKAEVTFSPGGQKVMSYAGERLGDVCGKAGVGVMYGCQKGTCGTCSATITNSKTGQSETVRVCTSIVPKAPGAGTMEYVLEMQDAKSAKAKQLDWETVKASQQ